MESTRVEFDSSKAPYYLGYGLARKLRSLSLCDHYVNDAWETNQDKAVDNHLEVSNDD